MKARVISIFLAASTWLAADARADRVVLRDGQVLEGASRVEGDTVYVEMDLGTVGVPKSEVQAIERSNTAIAEYEAKKRQVSRTDAGALRALAAWAEANGLTTQARAVYRQILELAPDDATARAKLGFRRVDGKWITEDEARAAEGLVRYHGRWLKPDEVAALEAEADERRERRLARDEEQRRARERAIAEGEARSDAARSRRRLSSEMRLDAGFPPYSAYEDATAPLYVHPWMYGSIFYPPRFKQKDDKPPERTDNRPPPQRPKLQRPELGRIPPNVTPPVQAPPPARGPGMRTR